MCSAESHLPPRFLCMHDSSTDCTSSILTFPNLISDDFVWSSIYRVQNPSDDVHWCPPTLLYPSIVITCSALVYVFIWRPPQQMLRTHRSLEAYWRWLVISFFRVMQHRWNEIDRGKPKYSGKKPVPLPLCPPQIPHWLTRDRTRASAVRGQRLTAWAMAQPLV